jgi:hypothetical protein
LFILPEETIMTQPPDGYRQEPDPTEQFPPASGSPSREPAAAPPKAGVRRGVVITAVALAVVLVISGGVLAAWLLLRDSDRDGASDPVAAVNLFFETVYRKQDAAAASAQVCSEARDEAALEIKISTIREYDDTYVRPRFSWSKPEVVEESGQLAIVSVTVTMTTGDEKSADQTLHVSVLDKEARGWWVCDVNSVQEPGVQESEENSGEDSDAGE